MKAPFIFSRPLLILYFIIFVFGCQIDTDEIPQVLEAKSYAFSIEDMPELGNVLAPYLGRVGRNNGNKLEVNGGYNSLIDRINFKHILARMDSTGQIYMSMSILNENPQVIQNLVIGKDPSGKYLHPMIFTYTMSDEFYEQYKETLSLEGFKGNFERVNLSPYSIQENNSAANLENQRSTTSTNCPDGTPLEPQANPDPTDPNSSNNGGSSGGTSTLSSCSYELQVIGYISTETTNLRTGAVVTQTFPQWGMVLVCPGGPNEMSSSDTSCTDPNSGEVPIVDALLIILSESFQKNQKLMCIWDKLKGIRGVQNQLKKFDSEMSVWNLNIDAKGFLDPSNGFRPSQNAVTRDTYNINDRNTTIYLNTNSDKMNRPTLEIARTLMHEIIHAEIFRKVKSVNGLKGLSEDNFPGLFDYYSRFQTQMQHQLMAEHYISILADMLKAFDGGFESDETYEALAWGGLEAWQDSEGNIYKFAAYESLDETKKKQIAKLRDEFNKIGSKICD
jgi:hypothetical protein